MNERKKKRANEGSFSSTGYINGARGGQRLEPKGKGTRRGSGPVLPRPPGAETFPPVTSGLNTQTQEGRAGHREEVSWVFSHFLSGGLRGLRAGKMHPCVCLFCCYLLLFAFLKPLLKEKGSDFHQASWEPGPEGQPLRRAKLLLQDGTAPGRTRVQAAALVHICIALLRSQKEGREHGTPLRLRRHRRSPCWGRSPNNTVPPAGNTPGP